MTKSHCPPSDPTKSSAFALTKSSNRMPSPRSCSPGTRIDLETIDQLCRLFGCGVGDLFEYVADGGKS